jgi:hypothetical protein
MFLKFENSGWILCNLIWFGIMHLRLALHLLHFLEDLGEHYALGRVPNFYEIHPRLSFLFLN